MKVKNIENVQVKLEAATWKWWFYLIFVLIQFIPSYASKGFDPRKMGEVIGIILQNAIISSLEKERLHVGSISMWVYLTFFLLSFNM